MKKIKIILLISTVFYLSSCYYTVTKTREVPVYEKKSVPYKSTEIVKVQKEVPVEKTQIGLKEPYFPANSNEVKISVVGFTSSATKQGAEDEIANELEFRLLERVGLYQGASDKTLLAHFRNWYISSDYYYKNGVETLFKHWMQSNRVQRYKIINRDQIEAIMRERSIGDESEAANVLGVDVFLSGHVRILNAYDASFILKAIDPKTAEIYYTARYEGKYNQALDSAIDAFFFNVDELGPITVYEKKTVDEKKEVTKYKEERVKTGTKTEEYEDEVYDDSWLYIFLVLGGLVGLAYASGEL